MKTHRQFKRIDSYSRAGYKFRVKSVARTRMTAAPLHDRDTVTACHVVPPFLGQSPKISLKESAFLHAHSTDFLGGELPCCRYSSHRREYSSEQN